MANPPIRHTPKAGAAADTSACPWEYLPTYLHSVRNRPQSQPAPTGANFVCSKIACSRPDIASREMRSTKLRPTVCVKEAWSDSDGHARRAEGFVQGKHEMIKLDDLYLIELNLLPYTKGREHQLMGGSASLNCWTTCCKCRRSAIAITTENLSEF